MAQLITFDTAETKPMLSVAELSILIFNYPYYESINKKRDYS